MKTTTPHTPEPWLIEGRTVYTLVQDGWRKGQPVMVNHFTANFEGSRSCSQEEAAEYANRAVQCVNALAGIEDPAEVIQKVREFLSDLAAPRRGSVAEAWTVSDAALIASELLAALTPKPGPWDGVDADEFVRSVRD